MQGRKNIWFLGIHTAGSVLALPQILWSTWASLKPGFSPKVECLWKQHLYYYCAAVSHCHVLILLPISNQLWGKSLSICTVSSTMALRHFCAKSKSPATSQSGEASVMRTTFVQPSTDSLCSYFPCCKMVIHTHLLMRKSFCHTSGPQIESNPATAVQTGP